MDIEIGSILFYTLCGVFCILVAKRAEKSPKKSFWFIVILLSLVAGLRKDTVGVDTEAYIDVFELLQNGYRESVNNIKEQGFLTLAYIIMRVTGSTTWVLLVIAFITNYFIIRRLFEERENISFPLAVFIYFSQYYFMTLNTMRQWLAIAIVFYYSKYIGDNRKHNIIFCIAVAVATTMHLSAIAAFAGLIVYYFLVKSKKMSTMLTKIVIFLISPFVATWLYDQLFEVYGLTYVVQTEGTVSLINIARILFLVAMYIVQHSLDANARSLNNGESLLGKNVSDERYQIVLYVFGIFITLLTLIYSYADRVGQYFMVYEMLILPRYAKEKYSRQSAILFAILIFGYLRIRSFLGNGYEELPYLPFWG